MKNIKLKLQTQQRHNDFTEEINKIVQISIFK